MTAPPPPRPSSGPSAEFVAAAWAALLAAAGRGAQPSGAVSSWLACEASGAWAIQPQAPAAVRDLFELYLPLCAAGAADSGWVVGHLGQSLDGCIATHLGESCFVTGPDNILHLHRMRALCDAVVVGAGTVASDDPRLTTRLVAGPSPVRVVLDPGGRLGDGYRLFRDGAAPTLLCTASGNGAGRCHGRAERLELPADADGLRLDDLMGALAERGLRRIFVEGGGVTVSRCLAAGVLSRLQLAVAPLIIGQGRPGVSLPRTARLADALRLTPRIFRMGVDVLYDLDLAAAADAGADTAASPAAQGTLLRVL